MAKAYLASSFSLIPKVQLVCKLLEEAGITIVVKWWERLDLKLQAGDLTPDDFYSLEETKFAYERDKQGIKDCDFLVLVADDVERKFTGANIEAGMAMALDKPVYSLGVIQNSAMYYPVVRCRSIYNIIKDWR